MKDNKPLILITNDDGIDSPGIYALAESMKKLGEVMIVAPDRQNSAIANAVSVSKPLRVMKYFRGDSPELFGYAVDGTPSDCIKLALTTLVPRKPDLVVSGINHGQNTAINILYSGTVAGAAEGMIAGITSMAISIDSHDIYKDVSPAAHYAYEIAEKILKIEIPKGIMLNINVPAADIENIRGIKVTHHSSAIWQDHYEKRTDPFGRDYFWFAGKYDVLRDEPDSDDAAILNNYVSVTPIEFNFTNKEFMKKLSILNGDKDSSKE